MRNLMLGSSVAALLLSNQLASADCEALSKYGVFDVSKSSSDEEQSLAFRRFYCQKNFTNSSDAKTFGASFGIPIDEVPIKFSASESEGQWKQSYASFCDDESYRTKFDKRTDDYVKRASPIIVSALKTCLLHSGLHAWIE